MPTTNTAKKSKGMNKKTLQHFEKRLLEERRRVIAQVIDCVFIAPGRVPAVDKAFICFAGEAPLGLSRRPPCRGPPC